MEKKKFFFRTRRLKNSLGLEVALCKECINPEVMRTVVGCHFGLRRRHRTSALNCNSVMVWKTGHERRVIVCLGAGQYAHRKIGPDDTEQDEQDDVPVLQIVQGQPPTSWTKRERDPTQRDSTKRPNSQPKPNQNKNYVHSGQLRLTEG